MVWSNDRHGYTLRLPRLIIKKKSMPQTQLDASPIANEYQALVEESSNSRGQINWLRLQRGLVADLDWTPPAAQHLVSLARQYGAFMLRNALALAVAANIDDGELGF